MVRRGCSIVDACSLARSRGNTCRYWRITIPQYQFDRNFYLDDDRYGLIVSPCTITARTSDAYKDPPNEHMADPCSASPTLSPLAAENCNLTHASYFSNSCGLPLQRSPPRPSPPSPALLLPPAICQVSGEKKFKLRLPVFGTVPLI